jgi:hypothetical protein
MLAGATEYDQVGGILGDKAQIVAMALHVANVVSALLFWILWGVGKLWDSIEPYPKETLWWDLVDNTVDGTLLARHSTTALSYWALTVTLGVLVCHAILDILSLFGIGGRVEVQWLGHAMPVVVGDAALLWAVLGTMNTASLWVRILMCATFAETKYLFLLVQQTYASKEVSEAATMSPTHYFSHVGGAVIFIAAYLTHLYYQLWNGGTSDFTATAHAAAILFLVICILQALEPFHKDIVPNNLVVSVTRLACIWMTVAQAVDDVATIPAYNLNN